ncbi:flavodoxin [Rossellomorea sp. GCM10028870]|uniref:flavodoxin n=1 Tax=Rossellomorea sp. GCM10028870 TaxID=3273426 RepID=UPI002614FA9F|nr:flavodoxin [uncultured Rossellomorea sp.]
MTKKIIMIYASMSGNTEEMATAIETGVKEAGAEIDVIDINDCPNVQVLEKYAGILLGAYTWGDGELPYEVEEFYDDMDDVDLTFKIAASFGSCDSFYPKYGAAVDLLNEKLQERGARLIHNGLKVELTPEDEDVEACKEFGRTFASELLFSKQEG